MAKRSTRSGYLNNPNLPTIDAQFEYTPEMVQEIQKSKENILHFAENYFFIIAPDTGRQVIELHTFQRKALRMIRDNRFNILLFSRQVGKALALDTPVPVPGGWTTMGALKVGDKVYDNHGNICNVTHAHDTLHNRECFEIEFDSGERIVADGEHQWVTQHDVENTGSVKTTNQIKSAINLNHRIASVHKNEWHHIKSVTSVKSVPVRCITVDSNDSLFLVGKQYIPTHNTTISTIYLLWHAIFNSDQHILVVANKEDTAKEIFGRVRLAFEELPNWLKPGVKEYGKEGMELANGSRIKITTTTSSAGRGSSCNVLFIDEADHIECVSGDTMITLKNTSSNQILPLPISKAFEFAAENDVYEVSTHQGYKAFTKILKHDNKNAVKVMFDDDTSIVVSSNHEFLCVSDDFTSAEKSIGKSIQTINGHKVVVSVEKLTEPVDLYDICDVVDGTYLTNDVVSHNCSLLNSFWASVFPIISSSKKSKIIMASTPRDTSGLFYRLYQKSISNDEDNVWRSMMVRWDDVPGRDEKWMRQTKAAMDDPTKWAVEFECEFEETGESAVSNTLFEKMRRRCSDPQYVYMDGAYKLWDTPQADRIYVAGVDVAEGVSKDFTVVNILDITDLKCINQVALYTSNTITPSEFTSKLHEILSQWGSPILLSERNNCGAQVVDNLRKDFNYENIVCHGARELGRSKIPLGIISHSNTKYDCVANQRYWINTMDAVQINDVNTVDEFKDFIKYPNGSWKARAGKHDDRVMSISWALNILSDKIVHKYFEIMATDENNKPLILKPFDYGVKYFMNPNSMYVNEKDGLGGDALPVMFGGYSSNPDMAELEEMGWKLLGN
jgi:Terminase RNaseH-like domain